MQRRSRQKPVYHRKGRLWSGLRSEASPTVGDRLVNRKDAIREAQGEIAIQPGFQRNPPRSVLESSNAFSNFTKGKDAQVQQVLVRGRDPCPYFRLRLGPHQFGDYVGVEQKTAHNSTRRPKSGFRSRSIATLASGDSAKN